MGSQILIQQKGSQLKFTH